MTTLCYSGVASLNVLRAKLTPEATSSFVCLLLISASAVPWMTRGMSALQKIWQLLAEGIELESDVKAFLVLSAEEISTLLSHLSQDSHNDEQEPSIPFSDFV